MEAATGGAGLEDAEDRIRAGDAAGAIRILQPVLRAMPDSFRAHLGLARAYLIRIRGGETALKAPALRAYAAARRLVPPEREAHLATLEVAAGLKEARTARAEYAERFAGLPFAGECVEHLDALTRAGRFRFTLPRGWIPGLPPPRC